MKLRLVLLGAGVFAAAACSTPVSKNATPADVTTISLDPYPEGPGLLFIRGRQPGITGLPIRHIEDKIPFPLPDQPWQGFFCGSGTDLTLTLQDGSRIVYGPCRLPDEIALLRDAMTRATRAAPRRYDPQGFYRVCEPFPTFNQNPTNCWSGWVSGSHVSVHAGPVFRQRESGTWIRSSARGALIVSSEEAQVGLTPFYVPGAPTSVSIRAIRRPFVIVESLDGRRWSFHMNKLKWE